MSSQEQLDAFLVRAKFSYGWANLESSARRMVEHAVSELDELRVELAAMKMVALEHRDMRLAHAEELAKDQGAGACSLALQTP